MKDAFVFPSLVTGAALVVYGLFGVNVSSARQKYGVKAPATTGNHQFEVIYRIHQNTAENLIVFIPSVYLFSYIVSPLYSLVAGGAWVVSRIAFSRMYSKDPNSRAPAAIAGILIQKGLLLGAIGTLIYKRFLK
eukprot:Phypoly_transcript_19898.p1 GENE.Phypoly_transcript_19898~~Phypoly_transcript_19898.p1  ORF type:complete len:134 (+),score=13.04 Phypoly_transcript_19898:234-635(+)